MNMEMDDDQSEASHWETYVFSIGCALYSLIIIVIVLGGCSLLLGWLNG